MCVGIAHGNALVWLGGMPRASWRRQHLIRALRHEIGVFLVQKEEIGVYRQVEDSSQGLTTAKVFTLCDPPPPNLSQDVGGDCKFSRNAQ